MAKKVKMVDCSNMKQMYQMQVSKPAKGMKKDMVHKVRRGMHRGA